MRQAENDGDTAFIDEHKHKFSTAVPEAYKLYETAYYRLDGEREYLRNIPWSSVVHYCSFYGLTREQTEWMVEVIERVDNAVLIERKKEVDKKSGKP